MRKQPLPIEAKVLPGHAFFDIIEEAYRVFAYPKPSSIEVCERCCMNADIEADFFNPPIRELPLEYVQDWYSAAYDPNGIAKETWAYLLPRILEILASNEDVSTAALEVSLARFDTGNPESWSSKEWKILDSFQRKFLVGKIGSGHDSLDDVICMFRLAGWPLENLLDQVALTPDETLAQRLWQDWCRGVVPGREGVWITAFWESPDNTTVFDFYTSQELYAKIVALALADDTEAELAAKASAVASVIEASAASM